MELFSILSGISLAVLAFLPNNGLTPQRKAGVVALGALFAGYGLYVMGQDSGTWRFPAIIFALPFIVAFEVVRELREHRRREASGQAASGARPAPLTAPARSGPTTALPAPSAAAPPPVPASCAACGAGLRAGVRFCTRCGAPRVVPDAGPTTPSPASLPPGPRTSLPAPAALPGPGAAAPTTPLSATAWPVRIAVGVAGLVALIVVTLVIRNVLHDDGPSAQDQFEVAGALMAAARESACVNPAIEGQYFAEQLDAVIAEDIWAESPAFRDVVQGPYVELAMTCGYEYGLAALNSSNVVGLTYQLLDGAMYAATPPDFVAAPPADDGGAKQQAPVDDGPLVVPGWVTLWGGGAIGDLGYFAPADYAITTLANELGAPESEGPIAFCDDGEVGGVQYAWGDFLVFVGEEDFTYVHPAGETVTVEAPYVRGWMLAPGDGSRTGLRTAEGLGKDDSVAELLSVFPDAYVAGTDAEGNVTWEAFAGDMGGYTFLTTGEAPDDVILAIRSGTACG